MAQVVLSLLLFCVRPAGADGDEVQVAMPQSAAQPMVWSEQDWGTPPPIRVFVGSATTTDGLPIRAWYVDVDYSDTSLQVRPYLAQAPSGKEAVSAIAQRMAAYVAINGGYFDMSGQPATTFSLVKTDGHIVRKNVAKVTRPNGVYFVTRSAFGVRSDRSFDMAWIAHLGDDVYRYSEPTANSPASLAPPPTQTYPTGATIWSDITDAIGGGPILVQDGQVKITYDEEAFFGSGFESGKPYPRTAVGYTASHHLILFVVGGKRPAYSRGLTLPELAEEMRRLGCVAAMNLDGGGSTTLVVNETVLNQPSDGTERRVTSALTVIPTQ
ncbi:MAG: phosphodiester glycosidase family protein [Abitibacteriaceae bacterium]|nr:phosphodiester glycosidase family protein [Abditibacteriaceae bacterium]